MKSHFKSLTLAAALVFSTAIFSNHTEATDIGVYINHSPIQLENKPYVENGTTMVPMRSFFEALGATVEWDAENFVVSAYKDGTAITLPIWSNTATVNGVPKSMEAAPVLVNKRTYIPLRFVSESLGSRVVWDGLKSNIYINTFVPLDSDSIYHYLNGRYIKGNIIRMDAENPNLKLKLGLAYDVVSPSTEALWSIASRNGAIAAINGSYFGSGDVYKEPLGNLVFNNSLSHIGYQNRTSLGVDADNHMDFSVTNLNSEYILGTTNGESDYLHNWYARWMNRTPKGSNSEPILFTPARGYSTGNIPGTNVVVENGFVREWHWGDTPIPPNGFVINFNGSYADSYLGRFWIGAAVAYEAKLVPSDYNTEFWNTVNWSIEAGPKLITGGQKVKSWEDFSEAHFYSGYAVRSAIGKTSDNLIYLFATNTQITLDELAEIMKHYGVSEGLNLDGGGSTGLYLNGTYLNSPGRNVSNAIMIVESK